MKRWKQYLLVISVMFGIGALVTLYNTFAYTRANINEVLLSQCDQLEHKIKKHIAASNYCLEDSECRAVSLYCPWGSRDDCTYVIANRNHSMALISHDVYRFRSCIANDPSFREKYAHCSEEPSEVAPENMCRALPSIEFSCVNRRCVVKGS